MKKVSLIMLGLAFAFAGLQSFVKEGVKASEKTIITTVNENWSTDHAEETNELMPPRDWYVVSCITPQGLTGTTCRFKSFNPSAIVCYNPMNLKFPCTTFGL